MLKPQLHTYFQEYADSHRHPTNRLTHKIAIPLIVFHIVAMLDWVTIVHLGEFRLSLGYVAAAAAALWYLSMSRKLGLLMVLALALCFPLGAITPKAVVVVIAVVGWGIQLAGHSIWEKNRPAFLTNMLQALVGPLFFLAVLVGDWPEKKTLPA